LGLRGGGEGEDEDAGGGTFPGGGGVSGTFRGGIVVVEGVAGVAVAILELGVVATGPGGGGWLVLELAEPGRTIGFESRMLGLSA
jgi:hypothetical protein